MHTFDVLPKRRVAEGWSIVGIVTALVFLLWLAI